MSKRLTRRRALETLAVFGGGLAVGCNPTGGSGDASAGDAGRGNDGGVDRDVDGGTSPGTDAGGDPIVFDYYISASGDDDNPGTLASPWSITALNTHGPTYAGRKVGLIGDQGVIQHGRSGGVATSLYSLYQAQGSAGAVLQVYGGPSADMPTTLASCDSAGNYVPRLAVIDASNPSDGAKPTAEAVLMGQNTYNNGDWPGSYDNLVFDGLTIREFTFSAITFYGPSRMMNCVVKNCEIYNGQNVVSNNNPGAIWTQNVVLTVDNCKIHDLRTQEGGGYAPWGHVGIITFLSESLITNCTIYRCTALSSKNYWQQMTVRRCRLDHGDFGSSYDGGSLGSAVNNHLTDAGQTIELDHCIILGPISCNGQSSQENRGKIRVFNTTFYQPAYGGTNRLCSLYGDKTPDDADATWEFYNNIVYSLIGYENGNQANAALNVPGCIDNPERLPVCDYNAYGVGMTFGDAEGGWTSPLSLDTWQAAGFDTNSTVLNGSPFTTAPTDLATSTYAIAGPATTAGMGGRACGAVYSGGPSIGCNF
jgi:hypothetical protein